MINLTTFFTSLGIVNGNTQSTNFYDFWYGIEFSGGTITYNITEFMTYQGTNRYEFFKSLNSTYPNVFNEYTFYQNIDDPRIYDFYTFYTYAGEYLSGIPITPTPTPTPTATPTPTPSITPTPTPTPSPTTPVLKSVTNLAFRQDDTGNKSQFEFLGATGQTTSGLNTLMIASPNNLNITSITYSGYSCTKAIDIYTSEAGFLAIYYVNLPVSVISPTIVINLGSASRAISIDMRRINNATYSYPVSTYSISGTTSLATSTPNTISTDRVLFITGAYGCNGFTFNNGTGIYEPTCFTSTSFISESGYNSSNPTSTFNNTVFRPLGNTIVNYLSAVFR